MEPETSTSADGLKPSLRRTVDLLLRTLNNRVELFGLELEEEGRWLVSTLIWTSAAIFFAVLAITIVTVTIIMLAPEGNARTWVMVGFSLFYLFLAGSAIVILRRHVRSRRPPLSDTVDQLRKDLHWTLPPE